MLSPLIHLRVAGALPLVLAAAHVAFPKRLRWKKELSALSRLNRQIFLGHVFFIVLMVVMMGSLSIVWAEDLMTKTPLAKAVSGGLALFWLARLVAQLFIYDSRIWRESRLLTAAHYGFAALCAYVAAVFGLTCMR